MKVVVFGVHQGMLTQAMCEGLERLGHQVIQRNQSSYRERNYEECDAAVVFGLHSSGDLILREHREHEKPVMVVDYGYIKRGTLMYSNIDQDLYYSVGLNGLNGRSDPCPSPMPPDRWEQLGVPLQPWRTDGKYIIVCGQKVNDVAIGNLNPIVWAKQAIAKIQSLTTRSVIFRPHPEDPSQKRPIGIPHSEHKTFAEALKDAFAVVAYNSNCLVEATVAGIPTFTLGLGSMVQGVTNTDLSRIDNPLTFDREQWAYDLAWRQYTIREIREGLPWQYLIEKKISTWDWRFTPPITPFPVDTALSQDEIKEAMDITVESWGRGTLTDQEKIEESLGIKMGDGGSITVTEDKAEEEILPPEEFFKKYVSSISSVSPIIRNERPLQKDEIILPTHEEEQAAIDFPSESKPEWAQENTIPTQLESDIIQEEPQIVKQVKTGLRRGRQPKKPAWKD